MSKDDDTLAAEFALGTLDDESRRRVAAALETDPALAAEVAAWERRLAALEDPAAAVAPNPRLWQEIEARLDKPEEPHQTLTLRADEGAWVSLADGVEVKALYRDPDAGTESYLLRLAPGTRLSSHLHDKVEECLMLEGEADIGALHLVAGDYHVAFPGSEHPEFFTRSGALVYIRGDPREAVG